MSINSAYLNLFVKASEKAAYGASKFIGTNDKIAADQAAVDVIEAVAGNTTEVIAPALAGTYLLKF